MFRIGVGVTDDICVQESALGMICEIRVLLIQDFK